MKAPIFTSSFCHWKNKFVFILRECSSKLWNLLALLACINRAFFSCATGNLQLLAEYRRKANVLLLLQIFVLLLQASLLWMNFTGAKPSLGALYLHNKEDACSGYFLKLLHVNDCCALRLSEKHWHLPPYAQWLILQTALQKHSFDLPGGRMCSVPLNRIKTLQILSLFI